MPQDSQYWQVQGASNLHLGSNGAGETMHLLYGHGAQGGANSTLSLEMLHDLRGRRASVIDPLASIAFQAHRNTMMSSHLHESNNQPSQPNGSHLTNEFNQYLHQFSNKQTSSAIPATQSQQMPDFSRADSSGISLGANQNGPAAATASQQQTWPWPLQKKLRKDSLMLFQEDEKLEQR